MRQLRSTIGWVALTMTAACLPSLVRAADDSAAGIEYFEKHIRPVLVEHCYECHAAATEAKGGLLLDTREGMRRGGESGPAVVPGHTDDSLLLSALKYESFEMPPEQQLSENTLDHFEHWIGMGAPDPRDGKAVTPSAIDIDIDARRSFWAYRHLAPPEPPAPVARTSSDQPIDRFVQAKIAESGGQAAARADAAALLRRVKFDLLGLPPTPDEIRQVLALKDTEAQRDHFVMTVDAYLQSPHFGERWGRHWLDVARYAESMGRTRNVLFPYAWRYRDYVIASFNADKPYDQFIQEQVAGDLLELGSGSANQDALIATGFLVLGSHDLNERNAKQFAMDVVDEQINAVTRAVLATTVGCARCHDHKFDPIPTTDYYALAGIFHSTDCRSGITNRRQQQNYYDNSRLIRLEGEDDNLEAAVQEHETKKMAMDQQITQLTARIADLKKAVRQSQTQEDGSAGDKPDRPAPPQVLARQRKQLNTLNRQLKQLQRQRQQLDRFTPIPQNGAMGVADAKSPHDVRVHIKGEISQLGDTVPRSFVQVLSTQPYTISTPRKASGRLELAQWITNPEEPAGALAARVMANRIWQQLFGRGLVSTVDNFGSTGAQPTHPDLLEYLAFRFVAEGWSVKRLIREIVLSETYRQSVHAAGDMAARDPDNMLLARQTMRRLEVEALRDAVLAVSGKLAYDPPDDNPVMEAGQGQANLGIAARWMNQSTHRSVYAPVLRGFLPTMFETFDFGEPSETNGRRDVTTVAPQALFMMNDAFILDGAREAVAMLRHQPEWATAGSRIEWTYLAAYGRMPTADEVALSQTHLQQAARVLFPEATSGQAAERHLDDPRVWAWYMQAIFSTAEFRYLQ